MTKATILPSTIAVALVAVFSLPVMAQSGTRRAPSRSAAVRPVTPKPTPSQSRIPTKPTGIAVVELFTSQGCSSCPPADAALRQIATVAGDNELPVYVLSFHVDYWNRLGWTDPYSDAAYSARQRAYASASGSKRVYTPQMIVSGKTEFLGSDKSKAHEAITKALGRRALSQVSLKLSKSSDSGGLGVQYEVEGTREGRLLNVAIVETPSANKVDRGENGGRTLQHVNVVRAFETVRLEGATGQVELELPKEFDLKRAEIIAYVQDPKSLAITGATVVSVGS